MACGAFCTKRDSRKENQADAGLMSVPILSGTLYRQLAEQCAGKSAIRTGAFTCGNILREFMMGTPDNS